MKKITFLIACCLISVSVSAWWGPPPPPPCGPGWGPGWGCGWYGGNRGLYNAAAITSIVANGMTILNNVSRPVYVQPAPVVVQQPVYVQQPQVITVQQPQPQVKIIYINPSNGDNRTSNSK